MNRKIVAGALAGIMVAMTAGGAGLQRAAAQEYLGQAEVHVVSKDGGYEQELQILAVHPDGFHGKHRLCQGLSGGKETDHAGCGRRHHRIGGF